MSQWQYDSQHWLPHYEPITKKRFLSHCTRTLISCKSEFAIYYLVYAVWCWCRYILESSNFRGRLKSHCEKGRKLLLDLLIGFGISTFPMRICFILYYTESWSVSLLLQKGKLQRKWADSIGRCYFVILKWKPFRPEYCKSLWELQIIIPVSSGRWYFSIFCIFLCLCFFSLHPPLPSPSSKRSINKMLTVHRAAINPTLFFLPSLIFNIQ